MKLDTSSYYPKSPLDGEEYASYADSRNQKAEEPMPETALGPTRGPVPEPVPQSKPDPDPEPKLEPAPTAASHAMDRFSTLMSWIMVPLLMPVYGMLLAFGLSILNYVPAATKLGFILVVGALNILVPALLILLLKKMGVVRDIGLNDRDERLWPYLISILCLGATAMFVAVKGAPMWLTMFFTGGAVAGLVELVVNHWWKISVHAAGVAGIVALLVRIMRDGYPAPSIFVWLCVSIIVAGTVGMCRVWLGRHTVWQVLAGYAVGFCGVFFMTLIH